MDINLTNNAARIHRKDLDLLKGIAILAVIFYHLGIAKSGYLGVDVFLIINGFFVIPKLVMKINESSFKYISFLFAKIKRFLPLLLISFAICLVFGYFLMLPDDFENLSEQIVASSLFANNILQAITTKDYWNVANEFKPLMHTWYLGLLFQFYLLFPLFFILIKRISSAYNISFIPIAKIFILFVLIISFALNFMPFFSKASKFYFLPFRCFEIVLGGYIGLLCFKSSSFVKPYIFYAIISLIILLLFYSIVFVDYRHVGGEPYPIGAPIRQTNHLFLPNEILVSLACIFAAGVLLLPPVKSVSCWFDNCFIHFGIRSYSYYVVHQIILAFYRYSVSSDLSFFDSLLIMCFIIPVSEVLFIYVERGSLFQKNRSFYILIPIYCVIFLFSLFFYFHSGVVRDIPELGIHKNDSKLHMHSEYCDRIFLFDHDFPNTDSRFKVLIVGNSFARDWANILLESPFSEKVNISYHYDFDTSIISRIKECDYLFAFCNRKDIPDYVIENITHNNIWGIGTKNFGESNGIIYSKRYSASYFDQLVKLPKSYLLLNEELKVSWGDHYVDLMQSVVVKDNYVRVFTDDHHFISQDCHHLTKWGAKHYASSLDFRVFHFN